MKHPDPDAAQASSVALLEPSARLLEGPVGALNRPADGTGLATGIVTDVTSDGVAHVTVSGDSVPQPAASILRFPSEAAARGALVGRTAVLSLRPGASPIILGIVSDRLFPVDSPGAPEAIVQFPPGALPKVEADKRVLNLEAQDEIRLTCGKSSLVMRRDGTVIVRGVKIVSRATRANKIRGATVSIN